VAHRAQGQDARVDADAVNDEVAEAIQTKALALAAAAAQLVEVHLQILLALQVAADASADQVEMH
jgi:hypothetical protein